MNILTGSRQRLSLPLLRWCPSPIVFVEPQEIKYYLEAHPGIFFHELSKNDGGFSYLMNQMINYTLDRGERYFLFTDDDVTDLRIRKGLTEKFSRVPDSLWTDRLKDFAEANDLAQLAVSFAGQSWAAKKEIQYGVGAWGVHLTDAKAVRAVGGYDESLPCFGDWDISARLLQAGYLTARTNLVTFVHKMKSHEGGACDVYKKKRLVEEAAHRVAAKFPGCATVKWVESHGLHEVRFNWKKLSSK